MRVYQIDYDLRKERNYTSLIARIKKYGTYCRPLESSWLIASNDSAADIAKNLKAAMDADDGLLVTRLSGESAWYGLAPSVSEWLKQQLSSCAA